MAEKLWRCESNGEPIDITECNTCHVVTCPVYSGFMDSPRLIEEENHDDKNGSSQASPKAEGK